MSAFGTITVGPGVNLSHHSFVDRGPLGEKKDPVFLGVKQSTLDKVANYASIVSTFEDMAERPIQIARGIESVQNTSSPKFSGKLFTKIFTAMSLPFSFISGLISVYFMANDGIALKDAYYDGDKESGKDRGLSFTSNVINVADSGMEASVGILKLQGIGSTSAAIKAAALAPAATGLTLTVFAIFSVIQTIALARIKRAVNRIMKIFEPPSKEEKEKRDLEKYQGAMDELYSYVGVTPAEELDIKKETGDYKYGDAFFKEVDKFTAKKHLKLERRVGEEMALLIQQNVLRLSKELRAEDLDVRKKAIMESEGLFKKYKVTLYKKMTVHALNLVAAVLGVAASVIALANPVGAPIAAGVILSGVFMLLIYSWYGDYKWKDSAFENGFKVMGKTLSNFVIPDAKTICKEEEEREGKLLKAEKAELITDRKRTSFRELSDLSRIYQLLEAIKKSHRDVVAKTYFTRAAGG